jgi:Beta-propeller repeat
LGGSTFDEGLGIAVDSAGAAYVTGFTESSNFPTTTGAFDTGLDGSEAFVSKLDPSGSGLAYSTFLGGGGSDRGFDIAVDSAGAAYVTGETESTDFPTTAGAFDTSLNGGFDAFVAKLDPSGSGLAFSTFLGGSSSDFGRGIAVDSAGAAHATGDAFSADFPTTAGAFDTSFNGDFDAFVAKLDPSGSGLTYSTFLGGSSGEFGEGIAVDSAGASHVTGITGSTDFPTTAGAFDTAFNGGNEDAFVSKLTFAPGPPPSTPRCSVNQGGRITAANGDRATFGGDARSDAAANVRGQETYRDHGPAQPQGVKSIRILALTCNQARTEATIFGEATIDGSGTHAFQIEVQDLGEPGTGIDTYRIVLDTGYDSGVHALEAGNVRIQKP